MRRTIKFLMAATAVALPSAAQAQACTAADNAANPLVALGFRAFARINSTVFDLSCYYTNMGGGVISFDGNSPSVSIGTGSTQLKASVASAAFDYSTPSMPVFDYGVAGVLGQAAGATDFAFAFAAPLSTGMYHQEAADIGITRAAGKPIVSLVPGGAPSTMPAAGYPSYVVARSTFLSVSGGGSTANPFAVNLINNGTATCNTGSACSYGTATANTPATISAWGTVISFRETRTQGVVTNAQVNGEVTLAAVPEPATLSLMAGGLVALVGLGYSRRRNEA